ncbi:retrovirus-related Pol polyprotein from transposon 297 [Trichonephila clavipes]|nr:retrovirus-related Pol polyprotein from transposon 297 [Trichonephila clavipes]
MLNFYRRFLPNAVKHQTKLNDFLVRIKKSKNKSIDWDEDSIKAFEYCKELLSESTTLAHPLSNAHLAIMVDASDNAVSGIITGEIYIFLWVTDSYTEKCQKCKVSRHVHSQICTFPLVCKRFDELHLDITRPLPTASGYRYCVTIIDRFTRWPEALPVMNIRAETVAHAVYHGWISNVVPARISSQSSHHCWRSPLAHASALIQREFGCVLGVQQTKQLPHVAKVDLVGQLGV